jgi:hypothetical protein
MLFSSVVARSTSVANSSVSNVRKKYRQQVGEGTACSEQALPRRGTSVTMRGQLGPGLVLVSARCRRCRPRSLSVNGAGRIVIQVAVDRRDFELLMTFGAVAIESEDGGDDEPYENLPVSACWLAEAGRVMGLTGMPMQ